MLVKIYDKLLFAIGLAVLAASYLFLGRIDPSEGSGVVITPPREHEVRTFEPPVLEQVRWADARPQPAGPKWLYDLFTPPLVFLDPKTATLSPEPPKLQIDPSRIQFEFPFVLVDISRDLYRIQLAGYFGQAPDYRVNLDDRDSGMPLIGRVGARFDRASVELKSFNVERRTIDQGGTPIVEEIATAVIVDLLTGEEITLSYPGDPHFLPTPKAEFRTRDEVPVNFVLRAGENRQMGDYTFSVRELTLDPKLAVVVREALGEIPEIRRELTPTPKEELPVPRPPMIQGGSNAPMMDDFDDTGEVSPFPRRQQRPGQRPFPQQPPRRF
jgi:hypothetical protein